jgi:hypothetical protein
MRPMHAVKCMIHDVHHIRPSSRTAKRFVVLKCLTLKASLTSFLTFIVKLFSVQIQLRHEESQHSNCIQDKLKLPDKYADHVFKLLAFLLLLCLSYSI